MKTFTTIIYTLICIGIGMLIEYSVRYERIHPKVYVDLPEEYPLITKDDLLTGTLNKTKDTLFIGFAHVEWPAPADYTIEFLNPKGLTRIISEDSMYEVPFELIEETLEKDNL